MLCLQQISVAEEVGVLSLLVVRAQGTLERVSVEWRTMEGTARSSGKTPPDFEVGHSSRNRSVKVPWIHSITGINSLFDYHSNSFCCLTNIDVS